MALIAAASCGPLLPGAVAQDDADDPATRLVWCHDEERSLVRQVQQWRCKYEIVSEDEAMRVKQERVDRIRRVLAREREPLVPGKRKLGTGTGFFISRQGHVLTNNHVIEKCQVVTVAPVAGGELIAEVRAADPRRDLALLETGETPSGVALFRDSDRVVANEPVTVVGYPNRGMVAIKPLRVSGTVRGDPKLENSNVFAMKIDIRGGNSGGPILDEAARVVGVVFAKIDTPGVYAKTGKLVRDVALGLRLHLLRQFLRPLDVAMTVTRDDTPVTAKARFDRAREFIAQIGCWR